MKLFSTNVAAAAIPSAICLVLIVIIAALSISPSSDPGRRRPSTFFTDNNGTRATYLVLQQVLDFAEQWRSPLTDLELDSFGDETLVVMGPTNPLSELEANALDAWIAGGGQLILTTGTEWPIRTSQETPVPGYLARHNLPLENRLTGARAISDSTVKTIGDGRIIHIADSYAFSNQTLRTTDNMVWLVQRCSEWNQSVIIDEYHHGFGQRRGMITLAGMFLASPWGLVCLQLALAGGIYILGFKRRFGRPIEDLQPERTSPIETAQALGGLFEFAQARALAIRTLHQYLTFRISASLGHAGDLSDERFRERISERTHVRKSELDSYTQTIARAMDNPKTSDKELIEIARSVTEIGRSFSHGVVRNKRPVIAGKA